MIAAPPVTPTTAINFPQWQPATWENYLVARDRSSSERVKLFFDGNYLLVDMGTEGINHASVNNLFTIGR